jgi:hypothetical protein
MSCEAAALAELQGTWTPSRNVEPLLVGNYLHSYFEGEKAHAAFLDANQADVLNSRTGKPKKVYQDADGMIETLRDDQQFKKLYKGHKEVIVTGKINGVKWMGKLDCIRPDHGLILDLKTTQALDKRYWLADEGRWGSFIENYQYVLQMAIYQELSYQRFGTRPQPVIIAVTKQSPPDKAAIPIDQGLLDLALDELQVNQERMQQVINGDVEPKRCEHCAFCRATKELPVVDMDSLIE